MTYEDWLPIAKVVEEHDLIVISDEIYAELNVWSEACQFRGYSRDEGSDDSGQRLFQSFCHDRLADGLCLRSPELISAMTENSPIYGDVCTCHGASCCA